MGLHAHTEGEEKKEYLTTNSIRSWAKGNTTLIFQFMNVDNVNSINNHNIKKIKKKQESKLEDTKFTCSSKSQNDDANYNETKKLIIPTFQEKLSTGRSK